MRKKKIFIGSSKKEESLAKKARIILEKEFPFEVIVWTDELWEKGTFRLNSSTLDGLMKATLRCDFGLMIGTKDDKVEVKGQEKFKARDNVIFELGLFMGRVGLTHVAFAVEHDLDVMSDADGICLAYFDKHKRDSFKSAINKAGVYFTNAPQTLANFFPSATLAATYYKNLLYPIYKYHLKNKCFKVDNESYDKCKIKVLIPDKLDADLNLQFEKIKRDENLKKIIFDFEGRARHVHVNAEVINGELIFMDLPTILTGINYSIQCLLPVEFKLKKVEYTDILKRELVRFEETLDELIQEGGFQNMVELIPYSN